MLPHRSHPPLLLELDLTQPLIEVEPDDPIAKLRSRNRPRLRAILRTLYDAGADPRVKGLVAKIGNPAMSLAQAQEIRDAVRAFATSGKPTIAWAQTFGSPELSWDDLNAQTAWSVVMRHALSAFYSHPWAWNEIGFGGPAYPRGYMRMGVGDHVGREPHERDEAFALDPVRDVKERGLE